MMLAITLFLSMLIPDAAANSGLLPPAVIAMPVLVRKNSQINRQKAKKIRRHAGGYSDAQHLQRTGIC